MPDLFVYILGSLVPESFYAPRWRSKGEIEEMTPPISLRAGDRAKQLAAYIAISFVFYSLVSSFTLRRGEVEVDKVGPGSADVQKGGRSEVSLDDGIELPTPTSLQALATAGKPAATALIEGFCMSEEQLRDSVNKHVKFIAKMRLPGGSCTGPESNLQCDPETFYESAAEFGIEKPVFPPPPAEDSRAWENGLRGIRPGPWLNVGDHQWYGNSYLDWLVWSLFYRTATGPLRYVETGGSNGVHASNTLFFDRFMGWKGMLIEPTVCGVCQLPYSRPNATNFRGAICEYDGTFETGGMNSFCPAPQNWCAADLSPQERDKVQCRPLDSYLREAKMTDHVDFFSLDVEGYFMSVLRSIDWERTRIDLIVVECSTDECYAFLRAKGYSVLPTRTSNYTGDDTFAWKQRKDCDDL